ncbi:hypothetical protein KJ830_00045, partial [bacterium]|nr:hypothetical protein [bacterium]MBU4509417.1 hypothetical protein [bacterium]
HFIKLNSDEVRTIKEAIEICQRGDKLASKYLYEIEEEGAIEWVYNIGKNFRRAEMYLKFVLSKSRIYYIRKERRGMKNYSNYMRKIHKSKEEPKKE